MALTPLNDALNRPKRKLGLEWRLWLAVLALVLIVVIFMSTFLALALFLALPPLLGCGTRRDPQFFRLCGLSFLQRAYYDPGKVTR